MLVEQKQMRKHIEDVNYWRERRRTTIECLYSMERATRSDRLAVHVVHNRNCMISNITRN